MSQTALKQLVRLRLSSFSLWHFSSSLLHHFLALLGLPPSHPHKSHQHLKWQNFAAKSINSTGTTVISGITAECEVKTVQTVCVEFNFG